MTDDKGAGEGTYSVAKSGCLVFRGGCGVVNYDSRRDAINAASLANRSFDEGRKAERAITARLIMYARHRDSCGDMDAQNHDEFPSCSCGLDGLKDEIRGGQDEK